MPLMAALDEINPEGRVCIGLARPIPYAMHVVRIIGLSKSIKKVVRLIGFEEMGGCK